MVAQVTAQQYAAHGVSDKVQAGRRALAGDQRPQVIPGEILDGIFLGGIGDANDLVAVRLQRLLQAPHRPAGPAQAMEQNDGLARRGPDGPDGRQQQQE